MSATQYFSIVIPTLNEEKYIGRLLDSIDSQTYRNFEVIVVDGGSSDKTVDVCNEYGVIVKTMKGIGEFGQRNEGTKIANGNIIINTSADVVFPSKLLKNISATFDRDPKLIGLSGPGIPINPPLWAKIEYFLYNNLRYIASKFKTYSISTNFIACKKEVFDELQFKLKEMNSDGLFGKELGKLGKIKFINGLFIFISSRRMREEGFIRFNLHYLYVIENFTHLSFFEGYKKKVLMKHEHSHKKQ